MAEPKRFVGLHAHTHASIMDGLGSVEEHIDFCLENGMDAMAFTEHGNCNSFAQAWLKTQDLKKKGRNFHLIPGVEAYYHPDLKEWARQKHEREEAKKNEKRRPRDESSEESTTENEDETKNVSKWMDPINRRHHMVVLAKSERGLKNLFKLVSRSFDEGMYRFPRIDARMLKEHGEDLIVTSACVGGFGAWSVFSRFPGTPMDGLKSSLLDDPKKMEEVQTALGNIFDPIADAVGRDNVYAELQFNKLEAQHLVNRALIEMSGRTGIRLTAAADSHYCRPELWLERELYKKLGRLRFEEIDPSLLPRSKDALKCELYPKNASQMWEEYSTHRERHPFYDDDVVSRAIETSWHIAHDEIDEVKFDTGIKLPSFVVPPGENPFEMLRDLCREGMRQRGLLGKPEYVERMKHELEIIQQKNFARYFLLTRMVMNIAYDHMMTGVGRGSGAASLVNYVLGITQIDPVKYDLMFARFVSPERVSLPDIDNDVSDRAQLLDLLRERMGEKNVVPIVNFNTLQIKSLVKDLSKLHGIDFDEVNAVTNDLEKEVMPLANTEGENKSMFVLKYEDCLKHSPRFKAFMEKYPQVAAPIKVLHRQNRSIGKHAGGVVIAENLDKEMPLIMAHGELRTPWPEGMNIHCLEPLGYVKLDILGISTLEMIEKTIALVLRRREGVPNPTWADIRAWYEKHLHPAVLDGNDMNVYEHVFGKKRFAGIFQYTNRQTQRFIHDFEPKSITDLAMATSIYRPGPLAAKVDKLIIEARRNDRPKKYDHPVIDEILGPTSGYCVFQEQILVLANKLAGMSLADCDRLRQALLKRSVDKIDKKAQEAIELGKQFVEGAERNGFPRERGTKLYEDIAAFAKYAFNACLHEHEAVYVYSISGEFISEKRMKDVIPGDFVRSRDESTKQNIFVKVVANHSNGKKQLVQITLNDGRIVRCTKDHKFRTMDGKMLPLWKILEDDLEIA